MKLFKFDKQIWFWCPGCEQSHAFGTSWTISGTEEMPTVSPSILVRWDFGPERTPRRCHSFIKDGSIQFLNDCWHKLKGKTVPLTDVNEEILGTWKETDDE